MHLQHGLGELCAPLSALDRFALFIAAFGHDVDHPGVTNAFLVNSNAHFAMMYNDKSVLENRHASMTFMTLMKPDCNLLESLRPEEWRQVNALLRPDAAVRFRAIAHHCMCAPIHIIRRGCT